MSENTDGSNTCQSICVLKKGKATFVNFSYFKGDHGGSSCENVGPKDLGSDPCIFLLGTFMVAMAQKELKFDAYL